MKLEEILHPENMNRAYKRVVHNKGAAGVDGMSVDELGSYVRREWGRIEAEILSGRYLPRPVRKVEIPKPGGGVRMLGIPCVIDRLLQQAIAQTLGVEYEPTFSGDSYGFRPGRSTHDAIKRAQEHIGEGYRWVVDLDLEKFFDRVNHDVLMSRLARRIEDKELLRLLRRYLQAGIMEGGLVSSRKEGVPQGSPLSPLLSNIMLDELDKELEERGHRFARYADDTNVYVKSQAAGERVMASVKSFLSKRLRLRLNEEKSAVGRPWRRQFLGYSFTHNLKPKLKISKKAGQRFKRNLKPVFRRARGNALETTIAELNRKLIGWISYYRLTEVVGLLKRLDSWLRRKLRAVIWRHWKTSRTRFKRLMALGVNQDKAARAAWGRDGPWKSAAGRAINIALPTRELMSSGLVSLSEKHRYFAGPS